MPIPDYQTLMLPLLRGFEGVSEPRRVKDFVEYIADEFTLSQEELAERIPSGQENLLTNRMAWARTYMGKAELLRSVSRGMLEITERGRALVAERPERIDLSTLRRYPEFVSWVETSTANSPRKTKPSNALVDQSGGSITPLATPSELLTTPREQIDAAKRAIEDALSDELMQRVRKMTPTDFEELVLRLLLAMGYGQGLDEMAKAVGGSGDGGIDGVINQDPLGLERVFVQAKRYKEGNGVSSPDIRNFVGALNINRANKGVFVTASHFTPDAYRAAEGSTVQVVLIDGARLAELMVRYKVGVLVRDIIELKEIDEGFFDE